MSRGRKPNSSLNGSTLENVFYKSVGTYVQFINNSLKNKFKSEPLSKHIKILGGFAFKSSEYKNSGVPVIRISDFNDEKIDLSDVKFYEESKVLDKYELNEGDIIIALTGGTIGKLAIVQKDLGKLYLNQRVGKFEIQNKDEFEQEYVYWIARSVQNIIKNLAWGGAQPNVSSKQIENIEFPIPNKKVQKGIIDFLNALKNNEFNQSEYFDKEIENEIVNLQNKQLANSQISTELNHQLALVKELRQAYLREAMQGKLVPQDSTDEPAEILLEKIKAEKEKLVAKKRIRRDKPLPPINAEEIPFEIPSNWTWCRLGECSINRDGERVPISLPERERRKKIYDYYGASGVIDKIDSFTHDGRFLLIGEDGANLVARSTPIAFIAEGKFWVNNHAHVIETISRVTTDYLYNYINGISLKPYITGGFQPKLSQGNLNIIVIPLPPLAEQKRIVAKLEKLMKFCDELEANIRQGITNADQLLQTALKEALEPKEKSDEGKSFIGFQ